MPPKIELTMHAKLYINISERVVEVEGDPEFVREVYADFKDRLLNGLDNTPENPILNGSSVKIKKSSPNRKKRSPAKKAVQADSNDSGINADKPKPDENLDTSELGDFFAQFEPKNNSEKILIYLKFITEKLGISSPNINQVFTCFKATGEKIPNAFRQSFYNTSSREGYIDYKSATDISITIAGENHFNHGLKRKAAE